MTEDVWLTSIGGIGRTELVQGIPISASRLPYHSRLRLQNNNSQVINWMLYHPQLDSGPLPSAGKNTVYI